MRSKTFLKPLQCYSIIFCLMYLLAYYDMLIFYYFHNKLLQMQQLKMTQIQYLIIMYVASFMELNSRCRQDVSLPRGSSRRESSARLIRFLLFQNSVLCSYQTKGPISLLYAEGSTHLLEIITFFCSWSSSPPLKPVMPSHVLLIFHFSDTP